MCACIVSKHVLHKHRKFWCSQVLADHKASLAALQAQKKVLDKETSERKEQLARFGNDWSKANTDKTAAKKVLQRLQAEQQDT